MKQNPLLKLRGKRKNESKAEQVMIRLNLEVSGKINPNFFLEDGALRYWFRDSVEVSGLEKSSLVDVTSEDRVGFGLRSVVNKPFGGRQRQELPRRLFSKSSHVLYGTVAPEGPGTLGIFKSNEILTYTRKPHQIN
ncbi:hypothetical protein QAD02_001331 [Eretmocerus hayati]|uniref:Uncharacterized protein n=1 Tax=Eretmocerus hayati TaxID=131215 RepID=A0ACC2NG53_9HYME|nr:hypothetical protein QAD02_001331 [Eretmocerus hayati]